MSGFATRPASVALSLLFALALWGCDSAPTSPTPLEPRLPRLNHLSFNCATQSSISSTECAALVSFFNSTGGDGWTNNSGWLTHADPCSWHGVFCADGAVLWLRLRSNGLAGVLPPEIGALERLTVLELGVNQLSGPIPPEVGRLRELRVLELFANWSQSGSGLTGPIPAELAALTQLNALYLGANRLTGEIPLFLAELPSLRIISIGANQLTGRIPPELGNASNLTELSINLNQLTGEIPPELGNLENLVWLTIGGNRLTGSIPAALGNLRSLVSLSVDNSQLSGPLPVELGQLGNLVQLIAFGNDLSGPIPREFGELTKLENLWLHENNFSGPIPSELGNLQSLRILFLHRNVLEGPIPAELGLLSNLNQFRLDNNRLTGVVPLPVAQLGGQVELGGQFRCSFIANHGLAMGGSSEYQAADQNGDGSICGLPLNVETDPQPPVLTVPTGMTVEATSPAGAVVTYSAFATDNVDPSPVVSCDSPSGTTLPLGSTVVTCTATDAAGNTATASFVVRVVDTTPPVLSLPADFAVDATNPSGAVVSYTVSATDAASVPTVSCTPARSLFAIGTHTVTCTATDGSGNSSTDSFLVTVKGGEEQITDLQGAVAGLDLEQGIETSLEEKLAAASSALARGERDDACGSLLALINQANALSGKKISAVDAAVLIAEAERIRTVLGC